MSIEVSSYDPKKVNIAVGGRILTGFASDGVVTVTKNEDSVTPSVGAKGDVAYSENANESGNVAITLMSTSSSLAYLRQLEAKRKLVNLNITDANDADAFFLNEENCRITKMPDISRAKEQGTVTVNIFVPSLNVR
ncbi:phage structural protein [Faecalispora jeddahensis]|uniref:phage structural protein n=1 Tax=Faecalispora jeddahensis TaxID=1414721 RepID=UPI0027B9861F|nr:phage protein [Faecalispora jeddahensis]